jgi:rubrerythrin
VITASQETDVDEVRHLLVERRIRRVPVVDGGRLVGIVSRSDVIALLTTEWACRVCGQTERGPNPPQRCPTCDAGQDRFLQQEPVPGS